MRFGWGEVGDSITSIPVALTRPLLPGGGSTGAQEMPFSGMWLCKSQVGPCVLWPKLMLSIHYLSHHLGVGLRGKETLFCLFVILGFLLCKFVFSQVAGRMGMFWQCKTLSSSFSGAKELLLIR